MSISRFLFAALAALSLTSAAAAQTPAVQASAERFRGHVEFLASDLLEGRESGTRGYDVAAAYVAAEFRKLGLQPGAAGESWHMQVPLRRSLHAAPPRAALITGEKTAQLVSGKDFALRPVSSSRTLSLDAPLVFVGHGISDSVLGVDEYAGLDVRGKIAVMLSGTPSSVSGEVAAHLLSSKGETAAAKGAVGYIEISTRQPPASEARLLESGSRPVIGWAEPQSAAGPGQAKAARITLADSWAERLFEGAPQTLRELRSKVQGQTAAQGFVLPGRLTVEAQSEWQDFTSSNVLGVLPGSDPTLAEEVIILSGHLDHLGLVASAAEGADAIHNGAIDNAGGIATMLEAARLFTATGTRPKRTIMFLATTAEERGLLGADYFAAHPPLPVERIAGLVNLDMPLLLYDFVDVTAHGAAHSTMGATVAAAGAEMGVAVAADPMPEQTLFVRSDHYPFVKRGIPSIFLMTGHGNGGKKVWDSFLASTYHRPNDDLSQPIDWRAGARFAELNYRIARALADAPERPLWYQGSYFGQVFAPARPKAMP